MEDKETQTSVASELTQTYILNLLKENPAVLVSSFLKESAYRWFIRLLSMGATAYQIKTTIDWCFQDLYWKSRLGDPGTLFHRWNDLSSKALASKKEQEARMPRNANMITPILLADYWAIENGEMSQNEAKALAASAKYYLDFYGEGGSGQRWKAILALAEGVGTIRSLMRECVVA
jgi:hypothetical protein